MNFSQKILALFALTSLIRIDLATARETVVIKDSENQIIGALKTSKIAKNPSWQTHKLAPKGSASITVSGNLADQGVKYIIHAAPGSMGSFDESTEPTIKSIRASIANSIYLADQMKLKKIAIPLIGGGIFLDRLNVKPEELAYHIVEAALSTKSNIQIAFVAYGDEDAKTFRAGYKNSRENARPRSQLVQLKNWLLSVLFKRKTHAEKFLSRSSVVQGSITKFEVHGAEAIVNAANMELQFGGGLSGVIGNASGQASEIDKINSELINKYYQD